MRLERPSAGQPTRPARDGDRIQGRVAHRYPGFPQVDVARGRSATRMTGMFGRARQDRLFARFVERGDVQALGEVFDATAPELMRIAAHLVGSREQAADLVQNAFLIALEKRAEFASERRVLPWLCGIVARLARNERRRALRRFPEATRPDSKPSGREDPGAAAEALEFRAAFAHAMAGLPAVYRPVLELHLEQGLDAGAIGAALGRPSGTVRTQIVRGL